MNTLAATIPEGGMEALLWLVLGAVWLIAQIVSRITQAKQARSPGDLEPGEETPDGGPSTPTRPTPQKSRMPDEIREFLEELSGSATPPPPAPVSRPEPVPLPVQPVYQQPPPPRPPAAPAPLASEILPPPLMTVAQSRVSRNLVTTGQTRYRASTSMPPMAITLIGRRENLDGAPIPNLRDPARLRDAMLGRIILSSPVGMGPGGQKSR